MSVRIEQRAMARLAAAAGAAMQVDCRFAGGIADLLNIDGMAVADIQHAGIEWG
ncbi:MAG: hypothetical protein H0T75_14780 [Rhizobiales bacterium]|nr:hypothetical protein [Hyphomicrobiales bacterium]